MGKIKKYSLFIILAVLLIIATITCIVKATNVKKDTPEPEIEEVSAMEEEEPMLIDLVEKEEDEKTKDPEIDEGNQQNEQKEENKNDREDNGIPYYIKVNNQANVVTIYTKDENGNYTVPYKAMICSIGTATPAAGSVYTIPGGKWDRWTWGQMEGGVWAQYYTRIKGSILFHSVPYTSKDKGTLEYWEYDKLGTKASAGCIRLTVQDAKCIYENCKPGTKVEFYADSNPGPLGKPAAQKISEDEAVRGWDPTDPDANNPWRNYVKEVKNEPLAPSTPVEVPKIDETSVNPTIPTEPETPTQPEESTDPIKPSEGENSGSETEPTNPDESSNKPTTEPESHNDSGDSGENVKNE